MIHLLDVRPIARQAVLPPGAVAQAFEHPPLLHRLIEGERRPSGRLIGLGGHAHRRLHGQPQPHDPTSVPFERAVGRAGRRGAVERPARFADGVTGRGEGGMRPVADGPLARQRRARRVFLAAPQVEHDLGAETEGAHRQIACSASSASPKPTSVSAG